MEKLLTSELLQSVSYACGSLINAAVTEQNGVSPPSSVNERNSQGLRSASRYKQGLVKKFEDI